MQKEKLYELMNSNPTFFLATVDDGKPRVRGMLLYKADENGIVFHTGTMKDLYKQVLADPAAELCFVDMKSGTQLRVSGTLEVLDDWALKEEIFNHPSRGFLRTWENSGEMEDHYDALAVLRLKDGKAKLWTMDTNFQNAPEILL